MKTYTDVFTFHCAFSLWSQSKIQFSIATTWMSKPTGSRASPWCQRTRVWSAWYARAFWPFSCFPLIQVQVGFVIKIGSCFLSKLQNCFLKCFSTSPSILSQHPHSFNNQSYECTATAAFHPDSLIFSLHLWCVCVLKLSSQHHFLTGWHLYCFSLSDFVTPQFPQCTAVRKV